MAPKEVAISRLVTLLLVALLCGACGLKLEPTDTFADGPKCRWAQGEGSYGYWDCSKETDVKRNS